MVGEIRECINASLFLVLRVFWGKNRAIFMAVICDMAMGRLADSIHAFLVSSVTCETLADDI